MPTNIKTSIRRNLDGSDITFPQDQRISFEEKNHIYHVEGIGRMMPVSSVIDMFFKPFDAEQTSIRKCNGNLEAAAHMRDEWEAKGCFAREAGTFLHKLIENYLNDGIEPQNLLCRVEYTGKYLQLHQQIDVSKEWFFFKAFDKATTYQPFRTEWRIYDETARMAGTVDLICACPDGTYELYDWKRSSKTDPYKNSGWSYGIHGLEHLPDTSYYHYCLQQNLYRYMLEKNYGLRISGMHLTVLHPNFMNFHVFPVPHMDKEVFTVINFLKTLQL